VNRIGRETNSSLKLQASNSWEMESFYMINRYLVLLFFLTGCKQEPLKEYTTINYYRDFDYAKIIGISLLNPEDWDYPYVRVENLDTILRLQYYISKDEISYDYLHKRSGYWESRIDSIREINMQYFKKYYYKNLIYETEYHIEGGIKLLDQFIISQYISNTVVRRDHYFFNEEKVLKDLPWNISYDDWTKKSNNIDSISQNKMFLKSKYIDKVENIETQSTDCYEFKDLPINYFWRFSNNFKKVKCGSL